MREDKHGRIVKAARAAFLRYGYKRVNMTDIAVAAGLSRPALYLAFRNKEDIFSAVFDDWVDETIAAIEREISDHMSPFKKMQTAFDLWAVQPFEAVQQSSEARELLECSFEFAKGSLVRGYHLLEGILIPIVEPLLLQSSAGVPALRAARVLTGAVSGFKQMAESADELRVLIDELLTLTFAHARSTTQP